MKKIYSSLLAGLALTLASPYASAEKLADGTYTLPGTYKIVLGDDYSDRQKTDVEITVNIIYEASMGKYIMKEQGTKMFPYDVKFRFDDATNTATFSQEIVNASDMTLFTAYEYDWGSNCIDNYKVKFNPETGSLEVPAQDFGFGWLPDGEETSPFPSFIAQYDVKSIVQIEDEGGDNPGGGDVETPGDEEWKDLGNATLMDGWILPLLGINQYENEYEVLMQQNVENSNLYRLVNPYKTGPAALFNAHPTKEGYIEFDVTDPEKVKFSYVYAGFSNQTPDGELFDDIYCIDTWTWFDQKYATSAENLRNIYWNGNGYVYSTYDAEKGEINMLGNGKSGYDLTYAAGVTFDDKLDRLTNWQDSNDGHFLDMTTKIIFPKVETEEPELEVEHLGTYQYMLTSLDIFSNRTEAGVATIEVYKQGEEYWMAETGETNYFLGQTIKFTYSESGDAIFESYVPGKVNGKPAIFSTFTVGNAGSVIEIMPMQNIPFAVETGFDFVPDAGKKPVGLGWLETVSETDDTPMDVIAAYLFEKVADEPEQPELEPASFSDRVFGTATQDMNDGNGAKDYPYYLEYTITRNADKSLTVVGAFTFTKGEPVGYANGFTTGIPGVEMVGGQKGEPLKLSVSYEDGDVVNLNMQTAIALADVVEVVAYTVGSEQEMPEMPVEPEPSIEYDITGNWTAQTDMDQGYGDGTDLTDAVTIPVKAAYVEGKLILTPMFDVSDAPLAFIVDTESGEVVAETTVAETINVEGTNYDYFYVGNDSRTNITGQLYNISDEQSRLTLETWAYAADYSSFGPMYEGMLYNEVVTANNVIILDYYFEGVPMYVAPTVEIINFTPAVDEEAEKIDGKVTVKCSVEVEATQATEDEVVLLWGTTEDEDNLVPAERVELVETEAVGTEDSVKTQHIFRIALPYDSEQVVYLQAKTNSAKTEVLPFEITKDATGVENITVDADSNVHYFNLQGVEISRPAAGTVVIRVSGDKAVKELVK